MCPALPAPQAPFTAFRILYTIICLNIEKNKNLVKGKNEKKFFFIFIEILPKFLKKQNGVINTAKK